MKYEFIKDVFYKGELVIEGDLIELLPHEVPNLRHCIVPHIEQNKESVEPVKPIKKPKGE